LGAFFYGRSRKSGINRLYDDPVSNGVFSFCALSTKGLWNKLKTSRKTA
jgi:hypothetical protein